MYYLNEERAETAGDWLAGAQKCPGSWWPLWMDWLQARSGKTKAAPRRLGNSKYPAGDPAPGNYVHEPAE